MTLEFLTSSEVWTVLKELSWGDRFERDLSELVTKPKDGFVYEDITSKLVAMGIVYRLRGNQGSSYLTLTDKGQAIVGRLLEVEDILSKIT